MKLAIVVQRYGAELNGGAELHARYIAEHLHRHCAVEVLTTCARDYITWRNEFAAGPDTVNGVPVRRFRVRRERNPVDFGRRSVRVFTQRHSVADELGWLSSEGPTSPALVSHLKRHAQSYDYVLFFSYRYYCAYHGIRAVPTRAVLVPTAERDPAVGVSLFGAVFRGVRGIIYNSLEERALIQGVSHNESVPGVVVGVGSEIPRGAQGSRFRERTGIDRRFALYVGRIDANKGCTELFDYYGRYAADPSRQLDLVLIGNAVMSVPSHPRVHALGFVDEETKYDALAAADVLIMPSYLESLSMVTLEAWALGIPVLVNSRCDVLHGQVVRSNAGLYYATRDEFVEALHVLESNPQLRAALGANGQRYFDTHYAWPVIEGKYLDMLARLEQEGAIGAARAMEPLPGWLDRRRRDLPPATDVVNDVPAGPVIANSSGDLGATHDQEGARRVT